MTTRQVSIENPGACRTYTAEPLVITEQSVNYPQWTTSDPYTPDVNCNVKSTLTLDNWSMTVIGQEPMHPAFDDDIGCRPNCTEDFRNLLESIKGKIRLPELLWDYSEREAAQLCNEGQVISGILGADFYHGVTKILKQAAQGIEEIDDAINQGIQNGYTKENKSEFFKTADHCRNYHYSRAKWCAHVIRYLDKRTL